ncbi:hypothetical protein B1P87_15520 [Enterococcus faecium]|nr:hypothetical protein B1P87_15520 [Enterococcus faecium]
MLEVKKLNVCYNDFLALNEISLKIQEGALTGIIGPNGAGKSTLLKAMLNIIPHQGEVSINNEDINKKLVKIAYVEQKADIDFTFPIKVKECVSMGTYAGMKVFQRIKNAEWQRVSKALEKVDMGKYSNHQIGELSGGQFQRVLLARCLAQNADFIFLDEPFVGIDLVSERIIMDTLKELKHQGKTVLIVHHDLSKVKKYFDNIILLNRNLIAHGSVESVFNEENLKKAYGDTIFIGEGKNANKEENKDYFAASDGIDVIYLEGQSEKGKEDPHAWLNLENGIIYAKNIEKQLAEKDPDNKKFYKENLDKYIEKLDSLDKEAKSKFASIPNDKKMIVTSEGCFKYFSKAYNVPSAYIWEINTEEEGTPDQIKHLVEKLRTTKVPSLFVESSVDDRPMKTVSKDTNIPIYSTIFTDSIAEKGQDGDSYYAMMKWNLDKIAEGLSK